MKFKFYFASFIACFFVLNSYAQKKQNVYFLKNNGRYVDRKDSADYTRIVQEPDSGSVLYSVMEYYPNGNPKLLGKSSTVDPIKLEGRVINYYPDRNKKQISNYEKGGQTGEVYDYYPNGRLYRVKLEISGYDKPWFERQIIKLVYDSTGNATVKDGNGHYMVYAEGYKTIEEEGSVKNGKRDSIWTGNLNNGKISFTENYANGKFINGTSTDESGNTKNYAVKEALPTFKGGENGFGRYLSQIIRYPPRARDRGIQGRVTLSFVVEKNGSLTDIKVLRSVDPELDAEAVSVLQQSPKWNPGLQHGIPVRVAYTMPINFSLGR